MMLFFRNFRKLRKITAPSRAFKRDLWSTLSTAYDAQYGKERARAPMFRFAAVGLTVVLLAFGAGTGVYAYESIEVVDGHALYPVKSGLERIEGWIALTSERRARFHQKMLSRRLQEADFVFDRDQARNQLLREAASELGLTIQEFRSEWPNAQLRQDLFDALSRENGRYADMLERVETNDGDAEPVILPELRQKIRHIREGAEMSGFNAEERRQLFREKWTKFLEEKSDKSEASEEGADS